MNRWLTMVALVVSTGCVPPPVSYFDAAPARHQAIGMVADTLPIRRVIGPDSVSEDGVRWTHELLRGAGIRQAGRAVDVLRAVLAEVPDSLVTVDAGDGRFDRSVWNRLNRQGPARRLSVARADAIVIDSVASDTVTIQRHDEATGDSLVTEPWLVLIVRGTLWADPDRGLRQNVR